ncbi:MAG: hypothetical protein ACE5HK_05845 [Candidatus Methylomirabilales bacterium]
MATGRAPRANWFSGYFAPGFAAALAAHRALVRGTEDGEFMARLIVAHTLADSPATGTVPDFWLPWTGRALHEYASLVGRRGGSCPPEGTMPSPTSGEA